MYFTINACALRRVDDGQQMYIHCGLSNNAEAGQHLRRGQEKKEEEGRPARRAIER